MNNSSTHKLIEDLKYCQFSQTDKVVIDKAVWSIERSQKFKFGFEPHEAFISFGVHAFNEGVLRPPYETTLFEIRIPDYHEIFLMEYQQGLLLLHQYINNGTRWYPYISASVRPAKEAIGKVLCQPLYPWSVYNTMKAKDKEEYDKDCLFHTFRTLGYISALESKSTSEKLVCAPEKLNKAREKKGKPPLFTYREISLVLPSVHSSGRNHGGSHASPVMHLRRGHIRNLTGGKRIPVSPCIVGASENGLLLKEYRAKLGQ